MEALLAAGQVTAQLKASQAQEQQLVSAFLHHLCEQARSRPPMCMQRLRQQVAPQDWTKRNVESLSWACGGRRQPAFC